MADGSKIEWTEATWNPITGCSVLSAGCRYCYAMVLAGTRMQHHWSRAGLTQATANGPVWNGQVRFNREWLDQPLAWRRPRMIFVNAHGDTFHDSVEDAWLDAIFAVAALTPHHTYQVLTKRSARMRSYFTDPSTPARIAKVLSAWGSSSRKDASRRAHAFWALEEWPLANVWLGVSAENQEAWDERVADLLACRAAISWVSAEPLLGPIVGGDLLRQIDWLVVGGEADRLGRARVMQKSWARSLCDQCDGAHVAFFFKQWGDWAPRDAIEPNAFNLREWESVRPDEETAEALYRVGKARAGRLLDGVEHNGMPG